VFIRRSHTAQELACAQLCNGAHPSSSPPPRRTCARRRPRCARAAPPCMPARARASAGLCVQSRERERTAAVHTRRTASAAGQPSCTRTARTRRTHAPPGVSRCRERLTLQASRMSHCAWLSVSNTERSWSTCPCAPTHACRHARQRTSASRPLQTAAPACASAPQAALHALRTGPPSWPNPSRGAPYRSIAGCSARTHAHARHLSCVGASRDADGKRVCACVARAYLHERQV
jgi:hypothetical protein